MKRTIIAAAAFTIAAAVANAGPATSTPAGVDTKEAKIPFLNQPSSILDFRANGSEALWIQDARQQWYYAETYGPCDGLEFAPGIGFRNRSLNELSRDSQIVVPNSANSPCQLKSLRKSDPPPLNQRK
jgi:hypothetical protein